MARELYGEHSANAPRDPLRLAEEFRAGLGDAALTDFLRRRIRDDAFEPGQIHRDLLDLHWADVLTTNYDTLLERAEPGSRRSYDLVLTENDLPHARGARIIKLHGSLRDGASVVISEEDYRTYPQRQAAFVNTARQVFIENELCLLGFSGDDPNFLQWAGWVRDRLSSRARRIYLVGALDLPPVKRRLLEARGVAPIDLAPAVRNERADQRHTAAISMFLAHLKAARPGEPDDWKPVSYQDYPSLRGGDHNAWSRDLRNPEKVVEAFRAALVIWRADRRTCPRWLVCPRNVRLLLQHRTDAVDSLPLALDTLTVNERREALLELAWRYDRGVRPLPPWLAERMDTILTPEALAEADPELVRTLARALLGTARVADDKAALATRAARFESLAAPGDLPALIAHERCLFAHDRLDFAFVAENANKVEGDDPVWSLRRAALLYWVGEAEEALRTIGAAVRELRSRVLRDPDSVALRSRLAWAKTWAGALRWEDKGVLLAELNDLDHLALRNYDPWAQLRAFDVEVGAGLRERLEARQIEPRFDAGTYRDNGNTVTFGNAAEVAPFGELRHVAERAGLPIRTRHVNVLGTHLADALRLVFEPTTAWYSAFLSTKPSYSKGPIDIHLGRISVARLDAEVVAGLRERLERAITFWRARVRKRNNVSDDVDVLHLYVEALSRVAARDDADAARAHARLAVELGSDEGLNHWSLNEPIGHLLKRAVAAVPPGERSELSSELLRFPLAAERDAGGPSRSWYDPAPDAYRFIRRSGNEAIFDARVAAFLHHLAPGALSRPEAAVRLLYLHEYGQLTGNQISSFADSLWKDVPLDNNALPESTNLLLHAFLIAPAPLHIDARARVYAHLFGPGEGADPVHLVSAATGRKPHMQPSEADAVRLFRNVTGWRPKALDPDSIRDVFARSVSGEGDQMMASILGIVAAPALARHDRTVERAEAALTFLDETGLLEALSALPVFYGLDADIDRRIEHAIRRPLASGDRRATPTAVNALDRWLRLSETDRASPLPDVLRDQALRALERGRIGGLPHLIYLAHRLIEAGHCGNTELDRIAEVLDELRETTDYGPPDGDADIESERAVSLPLIRAECVRLARALEEKGVTTEPVRVWRDLAARDPLPEVRNAVREVKDE
ncbi:SIR2 family NAD-dependent protein deacylase [Xanthobacter agilis]|uniref:SIR2 family NAD-dependent protein deacylase n=1 Tax=Xanthobacter agilis TaxID=47492 RepID=UPI00372ACDAE